MRRVVVTGLGLVTPLGVGVEHVWRQLLEGRSGLRPIAGFDTSDLAAKVGGQVPRGTGRGEFDLDAVFDVQDRRRLEPFQHFAIAAAVEAVRDAGWDTPPEEARERTGVLIGSGIGGLLGIAENAVTLEEKGPRRISPFFIPSALINEASGLVSMRFGFKGPCHSVVTACATGANAIGDAARLIEYGDADVMLAGGAEAAMCRLSMAGFIAMRAMSTGFNEAPTEASRPWDRRRDGFVFSEGAGVVVLEEYEHARARGARVYGEVSGYGVSGDAFHMSAPDPSGSAALRAMKSALKHAEVRPEQLGYVNAHATSTPIGDPVELKALRALLGSAVGAVSVSSTKSAIGHLLGAAGAVEAIFTLLAMRDQVAPGTLNLHEPEGAEGFDLVPLQARPRPIQHALSNSFGFGGTNASLVLSRAEASA
jgi:3-oxoacyl-[acyl-carrier-protein] synthase II